MEATNFANRHEMLGVGTHSSPTPNHPPPPRRTDDITSNTVNPGPTLREHTGARKFAPDPGNNATSPVHNSKSEEARLNTSQSTEMGDADAGVSTSQRGHRNSNYAPGYEDAANAVRQRSYNAEEHRPSLLAHEPVTPLSEVPPDLGNNTQQTSSNQGPGMIPGPSIGQKAKAPFAKIHVSNSLSACIHASIITQLTYPKGCWRGAPGKPRRRRRQLHGRHGQTGQG